MIDWDCDGYGPGSPLGPDADDNDATVNTSSSALAKYGNTTALLNHLGYNPSRVWYISKTGNDSTCAVNNIALPCATWWPGVYTHYAAGDAVLWRAGTYTMSEGQGMLGGTSSAQSYFMAFPGENVELDFSGANSDGLCIGGLSYLTLDGLHLNGGSQGYGINYTSYNVEQGLVIRNMWITGFYDNIVLWTAGSGTLVDHSVIGPLSPGGEHNIYATGHPTTATGMTIRNNIIFSPGEGGGHNIHMNGSFTGAVIQANIMYNSLNQCLAYQNGVSHSLMENNICYSGSHDPIFLWDYDQISENDILALDQNYNTFRNNTFYYDGTDYTTGAVNCATGLHWIRDDSQCKFNVCNNPYSGAGGCVAGGGKCQISGAGVACVGGTMSGCANGACCSWSNPTNATHDLGHNTYDNNVFVAACPSNANNMQVEYDTDGNGNGGAAWLATDTWRNNLFFSTNSGGGYNNGFLELGNFNETAPTTQTYSQFVAAAGTAAGNLQGNPLFVAASPSTAAQYFNLQVQTGSPAIGAGLAADAPGVDITGKSRGGAPDIGAYQHSGGSTPIALTINTPSLASGTAGTAYAQGLSASGGTSPYTWFVASGSLPSGLVLYPTGTISGTPAAAGGSSVTVEVQDSVGNSATATWTVSIAAAAASAPALSSLVCAPVSLSSNASAACTVTLSAAALTGGSVVTLASNSATLPVPSSVTVAAGAASMGFTATAGAISANSTAVITATLAGASTTASVSLTGTTTSTGSSSTGTSSTGTLLIQGTSSEVSGTANGAVVTPAAAPAGLTGQLTVRGSGAVNFAQGGGVSFQSGGTQNTNTAFYNFTGAQLQNIFTVSQGQISFNLKSSYSFAAREVLPQYNYRVVFDAFDNSQELFVFQVGANYGYMEFYYNAGGTNGQTYYVTPGQEDALFGAGVTMQVKLVWDGTNTKLYLNGALASTTPYTPATPNWTSTSSFTLGADDTHIYGGGYYASDDAISAFQVGTSTSGATPAAPTASAVQCSPASLASGASSACTVTLSAAAPSGGSTVALSSNNALLTVPASVTVAAGSATAGFTATAGSIPSNQSASVTAALNGSSQSTSVALTAPLVTLSSLSCGLSSLASSASTTCTVTLSAAAPSGGYSVALSSNNTLLTVPASITVAAGSATAGFTATAGSIASNQSASVTAALNGSSQSASVALTAPLVTVSSLSCGLSSLASSASTTCTVTLSAAAPSGGYSVALSSNNTLLKVPASVTVAAGSATAGFTATAGSIGSNQSAGVTATFSSSSQSASVALTAPLVTVSTLNCSVSSLVSGASTTCTVTLSAAAPSGGYSVALSSNNTLLTVPASITVAAGSATAGFTATAAGVTSDPTVVLTATLNGSSQSASIALVTPAVVASVACGVNTLASGASTTCTVTLSAAAPSGGTTVTLSSNNTLLLVPASITVAAGSVSAGFTATAGSIASNQSASVTATLNGGSQSASIGLIAPAVVSSLNCGVSSMASGASATCTVALSAAAPSGGSTVTLSSNSAQLTAPPSVKVAAGATSAGFTVTAGNVPSNQSASLTATLNGSSKSVAITVTAPLGLAFPGGSAGNGTVGTPFSATLAATGGIGPYTYSVSAGSLPAGLSLNASTGAITGTPTAAANGPAANLTFKVTDSEAPAASATAGAAINIAAPPPLNLPFPGGANGAVGTPFSATLVATGGIGPYKYCVTVGTLPAGLSLNASTGAITGTPTAAVNGPAANLTFKVMDSETPAASATAGGAINIAAQPGVRPGGRTL